jgi:hypothetical protein
MKDLAHKDATLSQSVRSTQIEFLRAELQVANTMLDLAAASDEGWVRERRRAQAIEACEEVARHLIDDRGLALSETEREELSAELWAVTRRLA